ILNTSYAGDNALAPVAMPAPARAGERPDGGGCPHQAYLRSGEPGPGRCCGTGAPMRLTLHSDYALRLMMLLAMEPDQRHTIEEVARRYGISRNHLMKVAQTLVQAGFIGGLRGRGGGLRL